MWRPNAQMEVVIRKLSAPFPFFAPLPPTAYMERKSIIEEGVFFMITSKSSLFHSGSEEIVCHLKLT